MSVTQAYTDILNALEALETELTPAVNVYQGVLEVQAAPPYWTNMVNRMAVTDGSVGLQSYRLTVVCTYHAGYLTEGGYLETAAQALMASASELMLKRPYLQSATYAGGVTSIDVVGTTLSSAALTVNDLGDARRTLNVTLTLEIPLLFELDSEDF